MRKLLFVFVLGLMIGGLDAEAGNRLTKVGYVGNVGVTLSAHSPFVDCKLGYMTELDYMFGFVSPAVGVDIDRFSVFASYNICSRYINRNNNTLLRTVHFGFAFNF